MAAAFALRRGRSIAAIAIALLISGTGVYYAFFAGVLILFSGAWSAVERRSPRHALAGLAIIAVILAGLTVQSIPTLLYHRAMGPNPAAATRPLVEAETYGLRIAPMLLPVRDHRIAALSAVSYRYERGDRHPGGGRVDQPRRRGRGRLPDPAWHARPAWTRGRGGDREPLFSALARLNLAALLLATTGGFGALFALLVSPQIRTYARMHVYIAFLALFCVALLLDRLWRTRHRAGVLLTAAVAFVGLFDQSTPAMVPPYAKRARAYGADAAFVHSLEARLPAGAQIFQLPYLRFPESGALPGTKLVDYDPLRPYLHSRALRWSYPTMFGRLGDAWTNAVADQPVPELVRTLSDVGFEGILVDRDGYADDGAAIVAALAAELGADSGEQATDRQVFFSLRAANEKAFAGPGRARTSPARGAGSAGAALARGLLSAGARGPGTLPLVPRRLRDRDRQPRRARRARHRVDAGVGRSATRVAAGDRRYLERGDRARAGRHADLANAPRPRRAPSAPPSKRQRAGDRGARFPPARVSRRRRAPAPGRRPPERRGPSPLPSPRIRGARANGCGVSPRNPYASASGGSSARALRSPAWCVTRPP